MSAFEDARLVDVAVDFGAHVEALGGAINEFLVLNNIEGFAKEDTGNEMDQPNFIGAFDV